ncbi:MAG: DUF502 domain-containing protein [Maioricimonas sp. JB045]
MSADTSDENKRDLTVTQVFLRGLAISLPTIVTIVILIWILRGVKDYIVDPATWTVKYVLALSLNDSVQTRGGAPRLMRLQHGPELEFCGDDYLVTPRLQQTYQMFLQKERSARRQNADAVEDPVDAVRSLEQLRRDWLMTQALTEDGGVYVPFGPEAVPYRHYVVVARLARPGAMPVSATGLYMEYAADRYFGSVFHLSAVAVIIIVVVLYFLGRFVNVRIGGWLVAKFESELLGRLPVVRNVYGSVKQVTDFLFSENQVEYRRVVAIEYPRRGIWSIGLVTGESMLDVATAVGEPCLSILIPSSPMPMTGYTMSVPRSEVLDLNLTVDQAMQFCISCGVLVPPHERVTPQLLQEHLARKLAEGFRGDATQRSGTPKLNEFSIGSPGNPEIVDPPRGRTPRDEQEDPES